LIVRLLETWGWAGNAALTAKKPRPDRNFELEVNMSLLLGSAAALAIVSGAQAADAIVAAESALQEVLAAVWLAALQSNPRQPA
jgi:hypothetical protein